MKNFKEKVNFFFFKGKERFRHPKRYILKELKKNKPLILRDIIDKSIIASIKTLKKIFNSMNKKPVV